MPKWSGRHGPYQPYDHHEDHVCGKISSRWGEAKMLCRSLGRAVGCHYEKLVGRSHVGKLSKQHRWLQDALAERQTRKSVGESELEVALRETRMNAERAVALEVHSPRGVHKLL
jgi:hypothetical protein